MFSAYFFVIVIVRSLRFVQIAPVRAAAEAAGKALVELLSPLAVKLVLSPLLDNTETKKHWQVWAQPCSRHGYIQGLEPVQKAEYQ